MKLEIDRRMLESALSTAIGAIDTKSNFAILSNVLLDFDGQLLRIIATDLELSIRTEIPARGMAKGRTAAPAKKLLEIARNAAGHMLDIELLSNDRIIVRAGKGKFELPVISPDDFPHTDLRMGDTAAKVDPFILSSALQRVAHAIPPKSDTFTLPAAYLHLMDGQMRFAATDGHRLAYSGFDTAKSNGLDEAIGKAGINIPAEACIQIIRLLDKAEEARVAVNLSGDGKSGKFKISVGPTVLSCSLMDGEFPDYMMIIPDDPPYSILLQREDFLASLKRLKPFTDSTHTHVNMTMAADEVQLRSGAESTGAAIDALKIDYDGPEVSMAFKLDYVRDVLAAFATDSVKFTWKDHFHGGVFTEPDRDDFLCLIMPMVV